jgi:hypothetical protein
MASVKMIALAAAMLATAAPAAATITYQFEATSAFSGVFGRFTVNVPAPITTATTFAVDDLNFCEVTSGPDLVCGPPKFRFDLTFSGQAADVVEFAFTNPDTGSGGSNFYYFAAGVFGTSVPVGTAATFSTFGFGENQAATLTIFNGGNDDGPPAVPEPASWAMLIAGFGLVGAAARRRRRLVAA